MGSFSQRYIRSIIEVLWDQSADESDSFLNTLKTARAGHWEKTKDGWLVQSSSGAGYSTSFHIPASTDDPSGITPSALQEIVQHIIENYRLVLASGYADESAAGFLNALLAKFPTIKGVTNNWMYLNH